MNRSKTIWCRYTSQKERRVALLMDMVKHAQACLSLLKIYTEVSRLSDRFSGTGSSLKWKFSPFRFKSKDSNCTVLLLAISIEGVTAEAYSEPSQTSRMEHFAKIVTPSGRWLFSSRKTSSQMFEWVLNAPLHWPLLLFYMLLYVYRHLRKQEFETLFSNGKVFNACSSMLSLR